MSADEQKNSDRIPAAGRDSATERFRTHLRARLGEMRENARRIGASSTYIESLDRSSTVVLAAISAAKPHRNEDTKSPGGPMQAGPAEV